MATYTTTKLASGQTRISVHDWRNSDILGYIDAENNTLIHTMEQLVAAGSVLDYIDLRDVDLTKAKLEGLIANCGNFDGAIMAFAKLNGSKLNAATIRYANLYCAKASNCEMMDCLLEDTDADQIKLNNSRMQGASLVRSTFKNARINYAKLQRTNCEDANFSSCELFATKLHGGKFYGANMHGAKMNELLAKGATPMSVFDDVIYITRDAAA